MENSEDSAILDVPSENQTPVSFNNESRDSITDVSNLSTSVEGSVFQSVSVESFSLASDLESIDWGSGCKDLMVGVDNPQKHVDSMETYITFRITTKTSREEFSEREYVVRRRYNDFIWLRQKLIDAFPTHVIPPLPAKHSLLGQLDRYARLFVICRTTMLHRFLNRVTAHPMLSSHPALATFLTATPAEFLMHRKNSPGFIGRMAGSLQQFANSYGYHRSDPEFDTIKDYIESLSEKLSTFEKIGDRIHKERKDYLSELNNYYPVFSSWAGQEPVLRPLLLDIGVAVETTSAAMQKHLINSYTVHSSQPVKEYLLYLDAINEAMERRDSIHIEYEATVEEMNRLKLERERLSESGTTQSTSAFGLWRPASNQDRVDKINLTLPKLLKTVETNQDKMEIANENLRADIERWKIERKLDLKRILMRMAEEHKQYYQECLSGWEKVLPSVKKTENNSHSVTNS